MSEQEKIAVQVAYSIDWEQRYASISIRVTLPEDAMRANLDCLSEKEMIRKHGQNVQEYRHYRLEGTRTQYVSDVMVETGDLVLLAIWKSGSLYARDVWEISIGKYGDDEQLLCLGNVSAIELEQFPEQEQ